MTDSLIAVCGKDWVVMGSDATCAHSVLVVKGDEDKLYPLDADKLLGCQGDEADRVVFCEYVQKNVALYALRNNGATLSTHATACWVREQLATAIRRAPYSTNVLVAGVDSASDAAAALYFVDYLGSVQKLNFAAHGYAAHFVLGLLDRTWRADLSLDEGVALAVRCAQEVQRRLVLNAPRYIFKAVVRGKGVVPLPPLEGTQPLPPFREFAPSSSSSPSAMAL